MAKFNVEPGEDRRAEIERRLRVTQEDLIQAIMEAPPFLANFLYARAKETFDDKQSTEFYEKNQK